MRAATHIDAPAYEASPCPCRRPRPAQVPTPQKRRRRAQSARCPPRRSSRSDPVCDFTNRRRSSAMWPPSPLWKRGDETYDDCKETSKAAPSKEAPAAELQNNTRTPSRARELRPGPEESNENDHPVRERATPPRRVASKVRSGGIQGSVCPACSRAPEDAERIEPNANDATRSERVQRERPPRPRVHVAPRSDIQNSGGIHRSGDIQRSANTAERERDAADGDARRGKRHGKQYDSRAPADVAPLPNAARQRDIEQGQGAWVMLSLMPIPQGLNQYEQVWGNPPRPGLRPHTGPGASRTTRAGASLKSPHEHKSETWREPNETSSGSAWESKPNHGKCWSDCCACAAGTGSNRAQGETGAQQRLEECRSRELRRDSCSASTGAQNHVRVHSLRLPDSKPIRRKSARSARGDRGDGKGHGMREQGLHPEERTVPQKALYRHAARTCRPPGSRGGDSDSAASDAETRAARGPKRRYRARYRYARTITPKMAVNYVKKPDRPLPIQAHALMAGAGNQRAQSETGAQQRLEGRGDREIRRDSRSTRTRARHHVRLLDMRLHCLQPIRRKGTRGTRGHGRDAARHGLREQTVYPTAEAVPPETLPAHAAEPGRPPGNGNSFPHCTASDATPRYANCTRRRRFAKRYWTRQVAVIRHVTHVWYPLNWNVICQRLPWQSAGSCGDHA